MQIRFLSSVLHHMAQADPLSAAMLSPNPNTAAAGFAAQMDKLNTFKSPSAGGGNGYTGSPNPNQYLGPDDAQKAKLRQNRISAPGTLQPHDRWQGQQLDQVLERGPSPDNLSSRSRSPGGDLRPKSTDFAGQANRATSPRQSGVGLGLDGPISPLLNNTSWASMVNTPLAPVFNDGKSDHLTSAALNMANLQLAANKVALDDARKYRRPTAGGTSSRNVSGQSETSSHAGQAASPMLNQYGAYPRSPVLDQFGLGLGDNAALAGLGMNFAQLGINPLAANPAQMLALAQAQQQLNNPAYASAGFHGQGGYTSSRPSAGAPTAGRPSAGRRSPMPNVRNSPTPQASGTGTGGGAGGGAGVAGPDDVDPKVLEDTAGWLRVLRLHVSLILLVISLKPRNIPPLSKGRRGRKWR